MDVFQNNIVYMRICVFVYMLVCIPRERFISVGKNINTPFRIQYI